MNEIVFEAPPKITKQASGGPSVWSKRLEPLRDHPDEWARVDGPVKSPHPKVNAIRNSLGDEADDFEFTARQVPTGEVDEDGEAVTEGYIWARFLSEETKPEVQERREARREAIMKAKG